MGKCHSKSPNIQHTTNHIEYEHYVIDDIASDDSGCSILLDDDIKINIPMDEKPFYHSWLLDNPFTGNHDSITTILDDIKKNIDNTAISDIDNLIDSLLSLIARSEFDLDLPSNDPNINFINAKNSSLAMQFLIDWFSTNEDMIKSKLINHEWAIHDITMFAGRGHEFAKDFLITLGLASDDIGRLIISKALDVQMRCRLVYSSTIQVSSLENDMIYSELKLIRKQYNMNQNITVKELMNQTETNFNAEIRRLSRSAMAIWQLLPNNKWPNSLKIKNKLLQDNNLELLLNFKAQIASRTLSNESIQLMNLKNLQIVMNITEDFAHIMKSSGIFNETKRFSINSNKNDIELHANDEFQAGRNAWACFGLQLVDLHIPIDCNNAILGYSMLYPYSDNYLDSPNLSLDAKKDFQKRFRNVLAYGSNTEIPKNELESKIFNQVYLIETCWNRIENPYVYHSLVSINDAQTLSLNQHIPINQAKFEDIHYITVLKGGTSVLADLYMCVGNETTQQHAAYAFHLGVALQIVDDLQDVNEDLKNKQQTLFTVPRGLLGIYVDYGAIKLTQYLERIILGSSTSTTTSSSMTNKETNSIDYINIDSYHHQLREGMLQICYMMTLKAIMRAKPIFSSSFIDNSSLYCPLPIQAMTKLTGMRTILKFVKRDTI